MKKGHPYQFIEAFKTERAAKDDGLIQRFLACAPQPSFHSAEEINNSKEITINPVLLFVFIKKVNSKEQNVLTLSEEAKLKFNVYFTNFREIVQKANSSDTFMR